MKTPVLIVEDDPDFAASLKLALELIDLPVIIAHTAEEAYRIMTDDSQKIGLGFFDVKLPLDDGITCLQQLRAGNSELTGIVMTGFRDEALFQRARDAGATEILLKPFRMSRFMELAREHSGKPKS